MTAKTISIIGPKIPTVNDLISGAVHSIIEPELCVIARKSRSWAQKRRVAGLPPAFEKDDAGRIFYKADAVLSYLATRTKHASTAEYDNSLRQKSLEKARTAKQL